MGLDIHAVIDYENQWGQLLAFTEGETQIPRDYDLFTYLAFGESGEGDDLLYPPRGLPSQYSHTIRKLFFDSADEVLKIWAIGDEEFEFNENELEVWERKEFIENSLLPNVDYYGASWLTISEIKQLLAHHQLHLQNRSPEFQAVVAALEKLTDAFGEDKVRLVFWFDGAA